MRNQFFYVCAFLVSTFSVSLADPLEEANLALCEKLKVCTIQEMEMDEEDNPMILGLKAMVAQQMDQVCEQMKAEFAVNDPSEPGMEAAAACMFSIANKTCEQLINMDDKPDTPECETWAKIAGID